MSDLEKGMAQAVADALEDHDDDGSDNGSDDDDSSVKAPQLKRKKLDDPICGQCNTIITSGYMPVACRYLPCTAVMHPQCTSKRIGHGACRHCSAKNCPPPPPPPPLATPT